MNNRKRGFILVTTLLFACILILIALPYVSRVAGEYKLMSKMLNSSIALDVAEAGADRAIWEICYNNKLFPGWTYANVGGNETWTISNVAFKNTANNAVGYYDVTASLPNGLTTYTIASTAYAPTKVAPDETKKVVVTYAGGQYHFTNSIAAAGNNPSITMSGNVKTDSYDSSVGPYGDKKQTNTKQGNVVTNGPISLSGNAYINGNANPGPGYPFSGKPPVSGSYATLSAPITVNPIPSSTIDSAKASNSNGNITITSGNNTVPYTGGTNLSVSGNNILTLPGGTYYFTSMSVSGNAQINVTGSAIIYVDGGNVSVSGNGIVNSGTPAGLGIYSTGSSISLSGNAAYVGTVYAPSATVSLSGNDDFYGAIVCGNSVDTGNASIHYDLALANANNAPANYRAASWMEQ